MSNFYRSARPSGQEGTSPSAADREVSIAVAGAPHECALDQQAPVRRLVDAIGDKWALLCLYALEDGPVRFNALERRLTGVSQKVLAQTLRKLEKLGIVTRTVFAEVPPRVDYELSPLGRTLQPLTSAMCEWSREHAHRLSASTPSLSGTDRRGPG
jgi:DNA-binding HxlR family transcriptional regulator